MKYYEEKTLKQLQKIELMILKEFDEFCNAHEINYVIIGGTALGAVRHGGFIPWDDDIDVMMEKPDYDKFLLIAEKELNHRYYILNRETDRNVPVMNTHLCLRDTVFKTHDQKKIKDSGIFLDIFCFDNVPDDDDAMKRQWRRAWFWGKMMTLSEVKDPVIMVTGLKASIFKVILLVAHDLIKVIGPSSDYCYQKANYYRNIYNNSKTERTAYFFDTTLYMELLKKEDIFPPTRVDFEGIWVNAPKKIEKYLAETYGDYMTLPPEEKRHNHVPDKLDFGPYADIVD